MIDGAIWWLAVEAIGLTAFPIVFVLFRFSPDRGYNFTKVSGLVLMSYLLWLGGTTHLIPNRRWPILLILALLAAGSGALAYRHRSEIAQFLRLRWRQLLFSEALFIVTFALTLFLRSLILDSFINPTDNRFAIAFLNSIVRSDYFPPEDPWLSGHSISYYYFGFLMMGALTKLTGISSGVAANLSIALITALAATATFGIISNLLIDRGKAAWVLTCGALAGVLFVFVSNIEGVFEVLAVNGVGSSGLYETIDIHGLDGPRHSPEWFPTEFHWPDRANTLADGEFDSTFPFYDIVMPVGYLSGRNIAVPILLLILGLITNLWRSDESYWRAPRREHITMIGFASLTLGALIATHAWDFPTACWLLLAAIALRNYRLEQRLSAAVLGRTLVLTATIALAAGVLFLPYFANASGHFEGIVTLEATFASKPHHHIYMWLPLFWLALCLALSTLSKSNFSGRGTWVGFGLPLAVIAAWAAYRAVDGSPSQLWDDLEFRGYRWLTPAVVASLLILTTVALENQVRAVRTSPGENPAALALAFSAVALLLILGIEFFYVDETTRVWWNTALRVNFQGWLLLSLAGAYGVYRIGTAWSAAGIPSGLGKTTWAVITVTVIAAGLVYPVAASFYFHKLSSGQSHVDGFFLLKRDQRDEYEAVRYLKDSVDGRPVVLEAVTDSYSYGGRISAFTGLPTVLGWKTHEFWFRGSYEYQGSREADVEQVYKTTSATLAAEILAAYDVKYVYVGWLEKLKYGEAGLAKFGSFMDVAFESGDVTIYRVR